MCKHILLYMLRPSSSLEIKFIMVAHLSTLSRVILVYTCIYICMLTLLLLTRYTKTPRNSKKGQFFSGVIQNNRNERVKVIYKINNITKIQNVTPFALKFSYHFLYFTFGYNTKCPLGNDIKCA
jgi:hypothetical protein